MCNVCAPNDSQQQQMFLPNESNIDTSNLTIGGDWNVTLQSLDKMWRPMKSIDLSKQTYFYDGRIRDN